ncbi:MAG: TPM domain-containing protein [Proteobacteria bacterium]|nr:TPM domain-containing protein [Pseudomonadota bacterium]MBU1648777.1 TPM domain-containing protein [Pseudomonadota bacterium]
MRNTLLTKRLVGLFLALSLIFLGTRPVPALEVPPLKGRVNDYAGILAPATARQLEAVLQNFETEESTQIVLLTVPSLDGASLEDFSLRVVEKWKPGQNKLDNGALLLIAKNDRKLRIEVGYGLEGKLTDLVSGRIIRDIITPRFKEGNFDQGVIDGISAMMAVVKGEFATTDSNRRQNRSGDPGAMLIFFLVIFSVLGRILARTPWLAAGVGAVFAPVFGALALSLGGLMLLALALLGFIGGLIAARMANATGVSSHGYWGGSGGFSSGSSGGFGGFSGGGGSFGGGGASGGW